MFGVVMSHQIGVYSACVDTVVSAHLHETRNGDSDSGGEIFCAKTWITH